MLVTNISVMTNKAARTRERIETVALSLFHENGFDATTVAQIAAAAQISEMTFFRYFPSKDAVVIDDPYDPLLAAAIAEQARDLPALKRVAHGILVAWHGLPEPADARMRQKIRIAAVTPSLRGGMWSNNSATEAVIVDQLVKDGTSSLEAHVAAAACLAALMSALLEWAHTDSGLLGEHIEFALTVVAGGSPRPVGT
jgi:AcrR family transcriptional regulator